MLERHTKGHVQSHTANSVSHLPAILGAQGEMPGFMGGIRGPETRKEVSHSLCMAKVAGSFSARG